MLPKDLSQLSDEELQQEAKKMKHYHIYDAVIIGVLVGIAIYSSVKNGFGWLTFLPVVYVPIAAKNKAKKKALKELMEERGLG